MRTLFAAIAASLALAACAAPRPPTEPPAAFPDPPAIAVDGYVDSVASAVVPMSPDELRRFLRDRPFIGFFEEQGTISPPVELTVLTGVWPEAGAVRRLKQKDGHYMVERSLENEPGLFRYQVWGFTGPAARGVAYIVGEQRITPTADGGAVFEWTYRVKPRSPITAIFVRNLQKRDIQPFMDGAVARMAEAASSSAVADQLPPS